MKNCLFFVSISISLFYRSQVDIFVRKRSIVQPSSGSLFESILTHGYLKGRTIRVSAPIQYEKSKQLFDVVCFHDGQMLFDSSATWNHQPWDLARAASKYLSKNRCILVGIDNHPTHRYAEFFPSPIYSTLYVSFQLALRDSLWNGLPRFDPYADALINEVFPLIENHWRVNRGGAHRTMVGSSMGKSFL
jgi:predicted alpha/beta superfamily hydrolase